MFNLEITQDRVLNQKKIWAYSVCSPPELFPGGREKFQLNKELSNSQELANIGTERQELMSPRGPRVLGDLRQCGWGRLASPSSTDKTS